MYNLRENLSKFVLHIFFMSITFCFMSTTVLSAEPEKIADVNDVPVYLKTFERELKTAKHKMRIEGRRLDKKQESEFKKQVIDSLVDHELLFQASQKQGIVISQDRIEKQLNDMKKKFNTEIEFNRSLAEMNLTVKEIKNQFLKQQAVNQYLDTQITKKIAVTDDEISEFYKANLKVFNQPERIAANHILIQVHPGATKDEREMALKKIQLIKEKLDQGRDFETLAKKFSEGPYKEKGGNLGIFSKNQMVKSFTEEAFKLKPGEISDIVKTKYGYHLIKVTKKFDAGILPLNEVKEKIESHIRKIKKAERVQMLLKKLKAEAKIKIY